MRAGLAALGAILAVSCGPPGADQPTAPPTVAATPQPATTGDCTVRRVGTTVSIEFTGPLAASNCAYETSLRLDGRAVYQVASPQGGEVCRVHSDAEHVAAIVRAGPEQTSLAASLCQQLSNLPTS